MKFKISCLSIFFIVSSNILNAQTYELDTTFYADYDFHYFGPITVSSSIFNILESPEKDLYVFGDIDFFSDFNSLLRFDSCGNHDQTFVPNSYIESSSLIFELNVDTLYSLGNYLGTTTFYKYNMAGDLINIDWPLNFSNSFYHIWYPGDAHLFEDKSIFICGRIKLPPPNDQTTYALGLIEPDGTLDTSKMADYFVNAEAGQIFNLEPYDDSRFMVFGHWNYWNGDTTIEDHLQRIVVPSCNIDASFENVIVDDYDSLFISAVDIMVLDDGKIIIIGKFKVEGVENVIGIARLNADGSLDQSFNYQNNLNCTHHDDQVISTIAPLHDGSGYLIGGFFDSYQGHERHCIAKIDLDGYLDTQAFTGLGVDTMPVSTASGFNYSDGVNQILPSSQGKFYIAGQLDGFNGQSTPPVFRIQPAPYSNTVTVERSRINIYPNPASKMVYIDNISPGSTIQVFTMDGKLHAQLTAKSNIEKINLEGFRPGIYVIRIDNGNEMSNAKLVVHD